MKNFVKGLSNGLRALGEAMDPDAQRRQEQQQQQQQHAEAENASAPTPVADAPNEALLERTCSSCGLEYLDLRDQFCPNCGARRRPSAQGEEHVHDFGRRRVRCTLEWEASRSSLDSGLLLDLAVFAAGPEGMELDIIVCSSNASAVSGVRHIPQASSSSRSGSLEFDFEVLAKEEVIRYFFVVVRISAEPRGLSWARSQVCTDGTTLFETKLLEADIPGPGAVVIASFLRGPANWHAIPNQRYLPLQTIQPDSIQETLSSLAQVADMRLADHISSSAERRALLDQQSPKNSGGAASSSATFSGQNAEQSATSSDDPHEDMLAKAIAESQREEEERKRAEAKEDQALKAALALSRPEWTEEDQKISERIQVFEENGDLSSAIENLDLLITKILSYDERDGGDRWQELLEKHLHHLDDLRNRASLKAPSLPQTRAASPTAPSATGEVRMKKPQAPRAEVSASFSVLFEAAPFEPRGGSVKGGARIRWIGDGQPPEDVYVGNGNGGDGRPCAPLAGGVFVVPRGSLDAGEFAQSVTVRTLSASGDEKRYLGGFIYWIPGELQSIEPARGPTLGNKQIRITTSNLGAPISEVRFGDKLCEVESSSEEEAVFVLPPIEVEGAVDVTVKAENGNGAVARSAFTYFFPEVFGSLGDRIQLSDEDVTAARVDGVNGGICMGAFPLRRFPEGRYFELECLEKCASMRCIAIGIASVRPVDDLLATNGRFKQMEARLLERVWLAGYDTGGSLFISDGTESKIPSASWRAAKDVKVGTRLGVLWAEHQGREPELVIFQDGVERVRLPASGRVPSRQEDIFAMVDLQGSAKKVSLIQGSSPPSCSD